MSAVALALVAQMAAACGVPADKRERVTAYALAESGLDQFAIHDNTSGASYRPANASEAIRIASGLIAARHSFDAGAMQIDISNWSKYRVNTVNVFDLKTNICVGAAILDDAERQVACIYNTGRPGCTNGYPERITAAYRTVRAAADDGAPASPPPAPDTPPPPLRDALHSRDTGGLTDLLAGHHPQKPTPAPSPSQTDKDSHEQAH
jgi:type IV secretion system protein VirB1